MARWRKAVDYAWPPATTALATLAGLAMSPRFDPVNIAMVYVLGVAVVALQRPRGPAIVTALLSIVAFDWCFVPPRGHITVDDAQYLFTFAAMLVIAVMISRLAGSVRRQAHDQAQLEVAAQAERVRSTLLASISHDLRTPLAVLAGAASSLAERGEAMNPDERTSLARTIHERAGRLSEEVEKMLDMTRLDAGAIALDRDWISVPELVAAVLATWRTPLAGHRLLLEVPRDLPLVRADAALMGKALANLLENVVRHTPSGTVVRIRARVAEGMLEISIEDHGGGMPKTLAEGAGLGLSICRAIVLLHQGRWTVERLDGGGSAFRMALPMEAVPSVPAEPELA
jgi:two-component system sensor histidine kinase KdpD